MTIDLLKARRRLSQPPATPLLERERELHVIDEVLSRLQAGRGAAILIEGEAGIGKSTLLAQAVEAAAANGFRVLRARGGELEQDVPLGVAVELLAPPVREHSYLLSGPARVTAPLFGASGEGGDAIRGDPLELLHGLFWLVLDVLQDGPVVVVVDDLQWADDPSVRLLHRIVDRMDELQLVVIAAVRGGVEASSVRAMELLRSHRAVRHLTPLPLTEAAVGDVLERICDGAVEPEARRAFWQATRGNPLFITELATAARRRDDDGPCTDLLPAGIPDRLGRFIDGRLAALRPAARRLAEAAAVLSDAATLRRAQALAGLDDGESDEAVRELVDGAVLDDVVPIAFRHPIVQSGIYASIPAPARAVLHRQAALALAREGVDPADLANQLLSAGRAAEPALVDLLLRAADGTLRRGEPRVAVALLRRALEEPATGPARGEVLARLATAEAAMHAPGARDTFRAAIEAAADRSRRARLYAELGHALIAAGDWAAGHDSFEAGLAEMGDDDPGLRAVLEAGSLSAGWVTMQSRPEIEERVSRILESSILGPANRALAAWIAFHQGAVIGSTAAEMLALVRRALEEAPIEELVREGQLVEVASGVLLETDELPYQRRLLTSALETARLGGPIAKLGIYAYCRAWPSYYMGDLADAIADAEEARRAAELGWEAFLPAAATVMALAHVERDDLDAAAAAIAFDADALGPRIDTAMLLPLAKGRLALARGDVAGAVAELERARDGSGIAFMRNSVPTDWRAWLAPALSSLGRRDEARGLAAEGVELSRAWGASWPLGSALRVEGVVLGGAPGIKRLREAEELLRAGPARLEHARALVDLGSVLRRHGSGRDARAVLAEAADLTRTIGARALHRRAAMELKAAGARPRRYALTGVESLTPAELRVAHEAVAGRTNREIAQALFVTPKAVEFHLANAYRKLGIGSRQELPAAIAATAGR